MGDCRSAWENPDNAARAGMQAFSADRVSIRDTAGNLGKVRDNLAGALALFTADESVGMNVVINT